MLYADKKIDFGFFFYEYLFTDCSSNQVFSKPTPSQIEPKVEKPATDDAKETKKEENEAPAPRKAPAIPAGRANLLAAIRSKKGNASAQVTSSNASTKTESKTKNKTENKTDDQTDDQSQTAVKPARKPNPLLASIRSAGGKPTAKKSPSDKMSRVKKAYKQVKKIVTLDMGPKPTKPVIQPGNKMRQLHWKRMILDDKKKKKQLADANGVLWTHTNDSPHFEQTEFENLFKAKQFAKNTNLATKPKSKKRKQNNAKSVLPKMRSQHLGILISSLPALEQLKSS